MSSTESAPHSLPDSVARHPALRFAPAWAVPYVQLARIDRPIGWWLLLLPCWQSSALASAVDRRGPYLVDLLLFLIGAIAMRGAGSTYNDLVDRKIDAKVERTRGRPLPSGRVTPKQAKIFLLAQCFVGLFVLLAFQDPFTIALGFASLLIVLAYPFAKRVTSWPQAVLGLAFAWGGLMGWAAVFGSLAAPAVLVYVAAIFWTIGYDTIYALQDIRDDAIAGVRSTARLFGNHVRLAVGLLYAISTALSGLAVWLAGVSPVAYAGVAAFALHCLWQVATIDPADKDRALMLFRANRNAGLLLFAGYLAASLVSFAR